jgi:hypothetical protein
MLKRRLKTDAAVPTEIEGMSFKDLFRAGAEKGFLDNREAWFVYREKRNITFHIYNQSKARKFLRY